MAVFVVQRDKDTNFIRLLRTYVSYINTSGIVNDSKKRMYFVSKKIKKKLKRIEASRKARINARSKNSRSGSIKKGNTMRKTIKKV